jgi:hypothetical protein
MKFQEVLIDKKKKTTLFQGIYIPLSAPKIRTWDATSNLFNRNEDFGKYIGFQNEPVNW